MQAGFGKTCEVFFFCVRTDMFEPVVCVDLSLSRVTLEFEQPVSVPDLALCRSVPQDFPECLVIIIFIIHFGPTLAHNTPDT